MSCSLGAGHQADVLLLISGHQWIAEMRTFQWLVCALDGCIVQVVSHGPVPGTNGHLV